MREKMIRYIARFVIEAETPLAVGSDTLHYNQDAPVEKDFNRLPYIPGTALAGAIRENLNGSFEEYLGQTEDLTQPLGSNLIFSDALLFDGVHVLDKLEDNVFSTPYFAWFEELPIRPHAKHDHKGSAKDGGLFDQEIVYKGSRFKFEISLEHTSPKNQLWDSFLQEVRNMTLFLGSGQYRGYGLCKIVDLKTAVCNTFDEYIALNPSLSVDENFIAIKNLKNSVDKWQTLILNAQNSLFHFGSGYEDDEVDAACYKENIIIWDEPNKPSQQENFVIPASSIKGALAHRVEFYHNVENKVYIDEIAKPFRDKITGKITDQDGFKKAIEKKTGENNDAVSALFGSAKDSKSEMGAKGRVIFKDIFIPVDNATEVKLMHNTIDRFTGGTLEGALFSEKAFQVEQLTLEYLTEPTKEEKYLHQALEDIKNGILPIGGLAAKGHGIINA
ncbi:CRISPR/Cas system CSM-associated protein Csm3, group 7 of RAMP superfamily [Spirosomataceae bacterium TFI 002]|nr:CRISPR/Cas system CSM-associated protein Csm3, group 7 of RAMP superfamily [Spirosomataceae bacterium TFI 002]